MRRPVTGHTEEGKAVVVMYGEPARISELPNYPGFRMYGVWTTDANPHVPISRGDPTLAMGRFIPPLGGTRFLIMHLPPDAQIEKLAESGKIDIAQVGTEFAAAMPDLAEASEPEHFGMHTTDTIDYIIVLTGDIWCELDDDVEIHLRAGECLVQCGTRHAWHNKGGETCIIAGVMVGAERK